MTANKIELINKYCKTITESKIKIGDKFEHFKGGRYKIVDFALDSESTDVLVIYKDIETDLVWSRPLVEFISYKDDKPRFKKIDELKNTIRETLEIRLNNSNLLFIDESRILMRALSYYGDLPQFELQSISKGGTYTYYLDYWAKKIKVGVKFEQSKLDKTKYNIRVSACYRENSNTVDREQVCFSYKVYSLTSLFKIVRDEKLFSILYKQFDEITKEVRK